MITEDSVEIDAPPRLVWDVFTDVEHWPDWTASVTSLIGLDAPTLAVGRRFAIKQPGMAKLVWQVTEIDPGKSWTWVQRSPGVRVSARHDVIAQPGGRTLVRQRLDQGGVLGAFVGRLMVTKTKRFLDLEGQGLKARSEQLSRADGAHPDTERRGQLLDALVAEFATGGIGDRSLRDVAAAVDTSHRMLLHHFGSREDLLVAIVDEVERRQKGRLAELPPDPAESFATMWADLRRPELRASERCSSSAMHAPPRAKSLLPEWFPEPSRDGWPRSTPVAGVRRTPPWPASDWP